MKIRILISLKKGVLDTQGKAIEGSLQKNLGFSQISQVRQGKVVELEIAESDPVKIKKIIDEICDKLLVNKIIEDYSYETIS
ncbi:MAG: phosphoribosylformylglycinamidine synthase subunit PurS [Proteobacteria bacterium]|nr:phosphoribosylformylglycinamidine synthase subunit PurS [Pseudomonadota bacterium]